MKDVVLCVILTLIFLLALSSTRIACIFHDPTSSLYIGSSMRCG